MALALLWAQLSWIAGIGGSASAQTPNAIPTAKDLFNRARFSEAVSVLQEAIAGGALSKDDEIEALQLMAVCYVRQSDHASAIGTFKKLLERDCQWELSPDMAAPDVVETFNEARTDLLESGACDPPRCWMCWVVGVAPMVALIIVTAVLVGKDDPSEEEAPEFPPPPGGQAVQGTVTGGGLSSGEAP